MDFLKSVGNGLCFGIGLILAAGLMRVALKMSLCN